MTHLVEPQHHVSLDDYEGVAYLSTMVRELRHEAKSLLPTLKGHRVWMVNSTHHGGGVAELLPPLLALLRELCVDANWLVMDTDDPGFFRLTKRLHNLIHGHDDPNLGQAERDLYGRVSRDTAEAIARHVSPGDVLVVHDPQPLGAGAILRKKMDITAIWRCHIGLDRETPETQAAWAFLEEAASAYDHAVFTAPEYIPRCLAGRSAIIHPAIDPLSHKNRDLSVHKLVGILANGGLIRAPGPMLTPPFPDPARRLQRDGTWAPATEHEDIGLLHRPIVTQISRWDRLKGFLPLMEGFVALKRELGSRTGLDERHRRSLQLARLVLAGPDPGSIEDDPEGKEVLAELRNAYAGLTPEFQADVAIIVLPMNSKKHNALLVNALQRCSDIVVQNSLQEGFGLTATEAMWKHAAVIGSQAAGLRQQIRPGLDGYLLANPEDPREITAALDDLLRDQWKREVLGQRAQQRVHDNFLIFTQVRHWLVLIARSLAG
ncbi:Trehalose synthase (ADP-glucose) (plasmid) [Neorhizobium galegae bv. officinalis bv. officinalis str. HAMBI 1141]|uniref:Trehalose synthase (ADP-glucose) n=2 Tax=Neorhizobium galegae TaxID=399 RepID=A0A068TIC3_NEOGA|nr:Trehalose synthase (ADP-glucose) [Neorhizobium galegae bv. officinalis bv. officinalis str. HAMBI 1141]